MCASSARQLVVLKKKARQLVFPACSSIYSSPHWWSGTPKLSKLEHCYLHWLQNFRNHYTYYIEKLLKGPTAINYGFLCFLINSSCTCYYYSAPSTNRRLHCALLLGDIILWADRNTRPTIIYNRALTWLAAGALCTWKLVYHKCITFDCIRTRINLWSNIEVQAFILSERNWNY